MKPIDQEFVDKIVSKLYTALKNDADSRSTDLIEKLNDLKPVQQDFPQFPETVNVKIDGVEYLKGEKGDTGDKGDKGDKGDPGKDGRDGRDGLDGQDGLNGMNGQDGANGKDGKDGKDGSPDTAEQIVKKLKTIKDAWVDVSSLKGFEEYMRNFGSQFLNEVRGFVPNALASLYDVDVNNISNGQALIWDTTKRKFVPGATTGGGLTRLDATGTVDGSNTAFTFTSKPTYIVSDGAWYVENSGWTWSGNTATLSVPPQTGVFGFA